METINVKKQRLWLVLCAIILTQNTGCTIVPTHYEAEATTGFIVDQQTKKPIEGAIGVAIWATHGYPPHNYIMVLESVTDHEGKFFFPAWGPKKVLNFGLINRQYADYVIRQDPSIVFFKEGYRPKFPGNDRLHNSPYDSVLTYAFNGKTFEMEKYQWKGWREYKQSIISSESRFHVAGSEPPHCWWKNTPHTLLYLEIQKLRIKKHLPMGPEIGFKSVAHSCGDPKSYLMKYKDYQRVISLTKDLTQIRSKIISEKYRTLGSPRAESILIN